LQIENFDGVSRTPRRFCDQLEAQRLEPEKHSRVKQWSGVNKQQSHRGTSILRQGGNAPNERSQSSRPRRAPTRAHDCTTSFPRNS
jgi:hypothetical protein